MRDQPRLAESARATALRIQSSFRLAAMLCLVVLAVLTVCNCGDDCKEEVTERCDKACDRVGDCKIQYTYNTNDDLSKTQRVCQFDSKPDLTLCGNCTDIQKDDKDRIIAKTCQVCNLCESDFECLEDSECKEAAPICDRGICVVCVNSGNCKDNSSGAVCVDNKCVGCLKDSDCAGNAVGPICDTKTNTCIACLKDEQCESTDKPQCFENKCVPCRCATIDDKKPYCLQDATFAVSCVGCAKDADCATTEGKPVCDVKAGSCVAQCGKDDDCQGNELCHKGACVDCIDETDCRDEQRPLCIKGKCGCESNGDCGSALNQCSDGRCVECLRDRNCADPGFPFCIDGKCSLRSCTTLNDCIDPRFPNCRPIGSNFFCVGCVSKDDCKDPEKPTCDTRSWSCAK